jgi:CRISPR-associated protein Csx3
VLIGGPPHSGKSHLTRRLDQALQKRGIEHYALRASPDGEGAWFYTLDLRVGTLLRDQARGPWTPRLAEQLAADVADRRVPLLVDVGGKVTPETRLIAQACTHAVLLAADPVALAPWRTLVTETGLTLLADLHSVLDGTPHIVAQDTVIQGVISGLRADDTVHGPCFAALVERLAALLGDGQQERQQAALRLAHHELVLDLPTLTVPLTTRQHTHDRWELQHLAPLLDGLPPGVPLSVYGRGPNWLLSALAAHSFPAPFEQFDARLGWVTPQAIAIGAPPDSDRMHWTLTATGSWSTLTCTLTHTYLPYSSIPLPAPAVTGGLIISGRLPLWVFTGLARAYAAVPALAIDQPGIGAVVVRSDPDWPSVGAIMTLPEG